VVDTLPEQFLRHRPAQILLSLLLLELSGYYVNDTSMSQTSWSGAASTGLQITTVLRASDGPYQRDCSSTERRLSVRPSAGLCLKGSYVP